MDNIQDLESQFRATQTFTQNEVNAKVKAYVAAKNLLIESIQEANEILLIAAGGSSEPDKVLAASKVLVNALAEVAKS
jgi:phosphoheptose isomerase